jgi:putative transposase
MDPHLGGHALFDGLGASPADRRKVCRELFRTAPDVDFADALRAATNGGWALGDARFKRQIAKALSRRVAPLPKGRPPRRKSDRRQLNLL